MDHLQRKLARTVAFERTKEDKKVDKESQLPEDRRREAGAKLELAKPVAERSEHSWPTAKTQQESRIADSSARAEAAGESERHRGRSQWTENPQIELKAEGVKAKDFANE